MAALGHGAAINRACRLEGLAPYAFVRVDGDPAEPGATAVRDRILTDEDAAQELEGSGIAHHPLGYCRLKGFLGLYRAWEVPWRPAHRLEHDAVGPRPAPAAPRPLRRSA